MNPLEPLAKALLEARVPCPICGSSPTHSHCSGRCGGTGKVWPEPLVWLAEQVLRPCVACQNHVPGHPAFYDSGCHGTGWMPKDLVALEWPKGWELGLGRAWYESMPPLYCNTTWAGRLGQALDDPLDGRRTIAALAEAVQTIAQEAKHD